MAGVIDVLSVRDNTGIFQGVVTSGGVSDDTTLGLSGSLTGALAAGETVRIYDGTAFLGLATIDASGLGWTFTTAVLAAGVHSFTARVADVAGNLGPVGTAYSVTIDLTAPAKTAAVTAVIDNVGLLQGTVARAGRTDDASLTVSGTLSVALVAGETIRIYDGATYLGDATVTGTGLSWAYTDGRTLSDNQAVSYSARVADAAGNQSVAGTAYAVTVDTTAPTTTAAVTAVSDNVGLIQGALSNGGVSDDTTLALSGTYSAALVSGETVRILDGTTLLGTATLNTTARTWTFTTAALAAGSHSFTARVADVAGNLGPVGTAYSVTIDLTAPAKTAAVTAVIDNVGLLQGTVARAGRTDDASLTVSGTLSVALVAGETIRIYDGATYLGDATVTGTGLSWAYTDGRTLSDNQAVSYSARVADAVGNQSVAGTAYAVTVDTTAPTTTAAVTAVSDNVGLIQGALSNGGVSDDTTLALSGTYSAALLSGETVRILDGTTLLGTATLNTTARTWTFTTAALAAGSHSFTARVADVAGNLSMAGIPFVVTIDTTAPTITAAVVGVVDNTGIFQGVVTSGGVSDDTTLGLSGSLTGALAVGETVRIYDGTAFLGLATIDASGLGWTFTTAVLAAGVHSFTARVADVAGNLGPVGTAYSVTIDLTAPAKTAAVTAVIDNVGLLQGTVARAGRTDDASLTVSGTLSVALVAGETIRIYDGATYLGDATVTGTGLSWVYTDGRTLSDNQAVSYSARVADPAGNQSVAGTAYAVTVDTSVAPGTLSLVDFIDTGVPGDFLTTDTSFGLQLSGQEAGAAVSFQRSVDNGLSWSDTLAAQQNLTNGSYQFRALVQDVAGNTAFSNVLSLTIANGNSPPTGSLGIGGTPTVGRTLTATSTISDANGIPVSGPGALAYQWYADGVALAGARGITYTISAAEVGRRLTVAASYIDNAGNSESVVSPASEMVVPAEVFFAPYVDMGLYPVPDLDALARQHDSGIFTLGFLQSGSRGQPAWAGLDALALDSTDVQAVAIRREINELRAVGGDVMVSLGGAAGTSVAQYYASNGRSAADLASTYTSVVDTLALRRLDFDIEGSAIADATANQLHIAALAQLQINRPDLAVWYTLPVLPQGLTPEGMALVRQTLQAGVRLAGVNVMAMDYGDSAAPPTLKTMGAYAVDAANAAFAQLSQLYSSFQLSFGWNQLGVTPMIGQNDVPSEVFRPVDAQQLEDFARTRGLGMLSMWSSTRDNPGPIGQLSNTASGLADPAGTFHGIFGNYGIDPLIGSSPAAGGGGTGGGVPLASSTVAVDSVTTFVQADAALAERFQLSYAWGRQLTINGFDTANDTLDLLGFWAEGRQAQVLPTATGSLVDLAFNQQQILLPGVAPTALTPQVMLIWQG